MIKNYPTKNILFPYGESDKDSLELMPYFWRVNHPEEFGVVTPIQYFVDDTEKYKYYFDRKG